MSAGPVLSALRAGLFRRRVQAAAIGLVSLAAAAASVLGLALAVDASAPFDRAFAAQRGADVTAVISAARASRAELAATTRRPGVTAAAGPFAEVTVSARTGGSGRCQHPTPARPCLGPQQLPPLTLAGRAAPGGPVDDLTLRSGRWPAGPGQVVLSSTDVYPDGDLPRGVTVGTRLAVTGAGPRLTVVGIAASATGSADGWVTPAEAAALRRPGTPGTVQMLYRFARSDSAAAIRADVAAVAAALPAGALAGTESYLTARAREASGIAPIAPFVTAFGLLGMVMSVLIVINVVSGAMVAGYRRIGVLKSIGFTPAQVIAAYTGQAVVPALAGAVAGVVLGNLLAAALLARAASAFQVGALGVPAWADAAVLGGLGGLAAGAALACSARAGRLSAIAAISAGRAPRPGRGRGAYRVLSGLRLPRAITIGLAVPLARPARASLTLAAVLAGATAVTLAAGLAGSLGRVVTGLSRSQAEQVQVQPPPPGSGGVTVPGPGHRGRPAGHWTVPAALRAQAGTRHDVAEADLNGRVTGLTGPVAVTAFRGPAAWAGYPVLSGHWYAGPGQAVVPAGFLTATGAAVGDTVTIVIGGRPIPVRIAGVVFASDSGGLALITGWDTLARAGIRPAVSQYDIGLAPGTSAAAYAQALGARLGPAYYVSLNDSSRGLPVVDGLLAALTLVLAVVAGLGVLNTVLLDTRERVRDLGVLRAVGMTPRQVIVMVVSSVTGPGLVAGAVAVPAGIALHDRLVPAMAAAAGTGLPASFLDVYQGPELAALALAGLAIAVAGALLPAGWAAHGQTAAVLRTE